MKAIDLKNSILQMAVEGKLVPQDPNDEPASNLLERIREEKHRLIDEGKAKFPKGGESIIYIASDGSPYEKRVDVKGRILSDESIADEVPFELPEGWCWARLDSIAWFSGGKTPSTHNKANYEANGILWVTSKDMKRDFIDSTMITLSEKGASDLTVFKPGTILMVTRSGILRRMLPVAMLTKSATINQDQKAICPFNASISLWLLIFLKGSDRFIRQSFGKAGTTVESIVFNKVRSMLIPLPPLAEQRRIAERVAELMPLVDAYGELEVAREKLDTDFPGRLRRSVLQDAVRGRLAPQDPADEPASALLERIRAERRRLSDEGKLRLPKGGDSIIFTGSDGRRYEKRVDAKGRESEPVCIEDEIPFEIPEGWAWARLKTLGSVVGGGTPKTSDTTLWAQSDDGIPWITPADMKNVTNMQVSHGTRFLSAKGLSASSAQLIPAGSIVMSSRAPIGYLAITTCKLATNQGFKSLVPANRNMSRWILTCLDAQMKDIQRRASGTTFKEISGSEFGETLVPIAPFPEQERVMENVKSLIDLVL